MGRIVRWHEQGDEAVAAEVVAALASSCLVGLPTETFYALAAAARDRTALARLFAAKGRAADKAVLVLVSGPEMLEMVAASVPEPAQRLMARFWPGPLTILFPARTDIPPELTGGTGSVGVRQPGHPAARRLVAAFGAPVTGTSANRAGEPPLVAAEEVARVFGAEVPLVVDAGPCPGGLPSTIVDASCRPPRLVRAGAVPVVALLAVIADLETKESIHG